MSLGDRLREERLRRHLSQEALAEALGASPKSISRWEQNQVVPQAYYRLRLSRFFGVSPEELFDDPKPQEEEVTENTPPRRDEQQPREILQNGIVNEWQKTSRVKGKKRGAVLLVTMLICAIVSVFFFQSPLPEASLEVSPLAEQSSALVLTPELHPTNIHAQRLDDPKAPMPYQVTIQVRNPRQDAYIFIKDISLVLDKVTPTQDRLNVWMPTDPVRYSVNYYRALYFGQEPGDLLGTVSIPQSAVTPIASPPPAFGPKSHVGLQPSEADHITLVLYSHLSVDLQFHLQITYSVGKEEKTHVLSFHHTYEAIFSNASNWHVYHPQGRIYIQDS